MECEEFEVLLEGTRGGGKTDTLLMDFLQFVGQGFGRAWRGVLFRQTYPELEEVVEKTFKWFPMIFPKAVFNGSSHTWRFPEGESLRLRYAQRPADYKRYHGHEYPWIAFEELTNWSDDDVYIAMMSVCRSSHPGMPRHYRATCNPYGVGHNWVKARFIDPAPRGTVIFDDFGRARVAIHSTIEECPQLMVNDPDYIKHLMAQDGPRRKAWLEGSWDITAGGMFDDLWNARSHVIRPFEIPSSWYVDRSFDWGSSVPYSVGWWAESDGTFARSPEGTIIPTRRGDLFRIAELYGWTGKPNEGTKELAVNVAKHILEKEAHLKLRVHPGPADPSIYSVENGNCIAKDMEREGVTWIRGDNSPGSRHNAWEVMRRLLSDADDRRAGRPGMFIFDTCRQFIRTVPSIPRDPRDMDDVDTDVEDHVLDETKYRVLAKKYITKVEQT